MPKLAPSKKQEIMTALAATEGIFAQGAGDELAVSLLRATVDLDAVLLAGDAVTAPTTWAGTLGLAAQATAAGAQQEGIDSEGKRRVYLKPPIGGWYFETNAAPTPGDKIFGYLVLNSDGEPVAGDLYEEPVELVEANQTHIIPEVSFPIDLEGDEE